jgi:hypothetical protein
MKKSTKSISHLIISIIMIAILTSLFTVEGNNNAKEMNSKKERELPRVIKYKGERYGLTWGILAEEKIPSLIKIGVVNDFNVYKLKTAPDPPEELYLKVEKNYPIYKREDVYTEETGSSFEEMYGENRNIPEVRPL